MRTIQMAALAALAAATLGACASTAPGPRLDGDGARARFATLKSLQGSWTTAAGSEMDATIEYRVVASGSAVEERVFGGTPHEMVTMYHMDGDALVLTHYCAAGNQPRMRAVATPAANDVRFAFTGLGNGDATKDMHMHDGHLVLGEDGHLRSTWTGYENGVPGGHTATFDFVRAK